MQFRKGQTLTLEEGTSIGPEDWGLPEKPIGIALGLEVAVGGQSWTAIQWNDEVDPNWCKTDCLIAIPRSRSKR